MKRHKPPPNMLQLPAFPPLRPKFIRIFPVDGFPAMHMVDGVPDAGAAGDEDGGCAVWAAAGGEEGGFEGEADVDGELGVETEG